MRFLTIFYETLVKIGNRSQVPLLALVLFTLRIIWGFGFFQAGLGKWHDINGVDSFFSSINIPFATFNAYFVATLELVGGLLLLVGLCARLAGFLLAATMAVAYVTAHSTALKAFFSNPAGIVAESPFWFLVTALFVFAFGPKAFSIDALLKRYVFKSKK